MSHRLPENGKILIVDDDKDILTAAQLLLKRHVATVHVEARPENIPARLNAGSYDVILLDMNFERGEMSGADGLYWLREILDLDPTAVVVLITAYGDMDLAVRAIKQGATDFIVKPWQNEKLVATLNAALELRASRSEVEALRFRQQALKEDLDRNYHPLIGQSPAWRKVMDMIGKVAASDANVLLLGENGTGKELVANELHRRSNRADEVFISVDMGSLTESLFESELFGHVKGAFTDAKQDKAGRFEIAHRGSLFLDEIANLSMSQQSKLLSVLEQRKVIRVGSNIARAVDIRLICATNRPLLQLVAQGSFRTDLLYRINTVEIQIPPLRERKEDIGSLVEYYLDIFANRYHKPGMRLAPNTLPALTEYPWPGNVRELKHTMERAVILADNNLLRPQDLFLTTTEKMENADSIPLDSFNLDIIERHVIERVLRRFSGNIKRSAEELGVTRTTLYRRLEKYGL